MIDFIYTVCFLFSLFTDKNGGSRLNWAAKRELSDIGPLQSKWHFGGNFFSSVLLYNTHDTDCWSKHIQLDFFLQEGNKSIIRILVCIHLKGYYICYKVILVLFKFIHEKLRYRHVTGVVIKSLGRLSSITMSQNRKATVTIWFVNMIYFYLS